MTPDTYCGLPRVTRRHWGREIREVVRYPLTALEDKKLLARGTHALSGFHCILAVFAAGYFRHWPTPDAGWPVITLGIVLALAMPARDLVERVPISEGLAALTAWAQRATVAHAAQIVDAAEVAVAKVGVDPRTPEDDGGAEVF